MKLNQNDINAIGGIIEKSNNILIIPHKSPDGDAIGAALALHQVFSNMGKIPEVNCFDKPPPVFSFLPNI